MKKIILTLTSLSILLLSGCQSATNKEKQNIRNTEQDVTTQKKSADTLTFSEFLKTGTQKKPLIMYASRMKDTFGKDLRIEDAYIFKDNKITTYNTYNTIDNLGEIAQMNDDEIVNLVEQRYDQQVLERIEEIKPRLQQNIENPYNPGPEEHEDKRREFNTKHLKEIEKLSSFDSRTKEEFPYNLIIRTDDTGNNTLLETVQFQFEETSIYDDVTDTDDVDSIKQKLRAESYKTNEIREDSITIYTTYLQDTNLGTVYDSHYKFFLDTDRDILYFSRLDNEGIQFTADQPGKDKKISVDPTE